MNNIKKLGIVLAVLLTCAGCASKKVAVQSRVEFVKTDITTDEQTETKTVETIKTETVVVGDTITKSVPAKDIKKPTGVVIENEAQRITINYDTTSDSFIIQGVQKAKKQLQEIKREITENKNKKSADKSETKTETRNETPLPPEDKGWSGVEWGFFWASVVAVVFVVCRFRSGIFGFIKRIF